MSTYSIKLELMTKPDPALGVKYDVQQIGTSDLVGVPGRSEKRRRIKATWNARYQQDHP
jgi:hypothetical protein